MILIETIIDQPLEVRTKHLNIDEPCIERGGNSTNHRGVLAEYINSNIPEKVDLCHYCGNGKCSNPRHLYWGTRKENVADSVRHGTHHNGWDKLVEKLGLNAAKEHMRNISNPSKAGSGNKGKPKSDEHKRNISLNRKGGRIKKAPMA